MEINTTQEEQLKYWKREILGEESLAIFNYLQDYQVREGFGCSVFSLVITD